MIKIVCSLILAIAGYAVFAQTIQSGGGSTASGIITTCNAGSSQFLFNSAGNCAGTANLTFNAGGGNPQILSTGGGNLGLGPGSVAFSINQGGGFIATTTSGTGFTIANGPLITPTASMTGLSTGTNADFLCLQANGTVLIQNAACTISSLRFKPDWEPYQYDALSKLEAMDVGTFHLQTGPNGDPNAESLQAGLSAESVAAIAPECAIYEDDMKTPKSYRQECVIALLVKALQQLRAGR